jgi:glycosyltransferase involved in cell wall biosynthesis
LTKVVHIQKSSKSAGGAALRLHNAFLESNLDSYILTLYPDVNDTERIFYPGKISKFISQLNNKLNIYISRNNKKEFGLFSYTILGADVTKIRHIREADVIYLHWVQGEFLSLTSYRKLAKLGKPIIIFMHDMWSITGGCHYSFLCEKYKSRCYDCQVFSKHKKKDLSSKGFDKKEKLYSSYGNFYFISPSKWLYKCAKESSLVKLKPVFHIPNIIDNQLFKPIDKILAKRLFNLNEDDFVIAFGAVSIDSPYKGWAYLQKALEILKDDLSIDKISILIFGKGFNSQISQRIPFKTRFTGYLKDEYSIAMVYNAADVFVTPSLADNLPTTILESLSCGTPVVGFNVGGIPDMINHKQNGYLAKYKDAHDFSRGIKYCLENKTKGIQLPEFNKDNLVANHLKIINSVIKIKNSFILDDK